MTAKRGAGTHGGPGWIDEALSGFAERARWVRANMLLAGQSGVAAGLAWFIAYRGLGHQRPFFAPISAVIVLVASSGQRWRRALEMVFGVALGIAVGDALIILIGVGSWQIAVVVALAILATVFLGGGQVAVGQAAASAVLVATLAPPTEGIYFGRFFDALTGGACALAVMLLLLPFNPLRAARRSLEPVMVILSQSLDMAAAALVEGDVSMAHEALQRLRASDADLSHLRDTLVAGRETAALSPLRWRSRAELAVYVEAAPFVDRAVRDSRVLVRRCVSVLEEGESTPADVPGAVSLLAEAVTVLRRDLAAGREPIRGRDRIISAARTASLAYREGTGFSGNVVVAQIRSTGLDLLRASGLDRDDARRAMRRTRSR